MTDISREEALTHFGVKGMRWGVRNQTLPSTISTNTSTKKPISKPHTSFKPTKKQLVIAAAGATFVGSLFLTNKAYNVHDRNQYARAMQLYWFERGVLD